MTDRLQRIPTGPRLGRSLIHHDDASKAFKAVDLLAADQNEPRTHHWRRPGAYDQGQTPHCVAFTGKGLLNSQPLSHEVPYKVRSKYNPDEFYQGAQQNDDWPGEAYDGTSGLGLCRYLKAVGKIQEYRWCFGLDDFLKTLSWVGPVGVGIWWYEDMFRPDANGFIDPGTSAQAGGHEIEFTGINADEEYAEITNSWGPNWGPLKGKARMTWKTLERLLNEGGDAFVITK